MKATTVRVLLLWALLAGILGWSFAAWVQDRGRLPEVPWMAALIIWVIAIFVGIWALVARKRLHPEPGKPRMAPLVAARTAALALAGSRTGAIFFGGYTGMALVLLHDTAVAAGRERLLAASAAALGGLVLAGLSLWLEHICRLPDDPSDTAASHS